MCAGGETCNERGQCTSGAEGLRTRTQALSSAVIRGLTIAELPSTTHYVTPGATEVTVSLELSAQAPQTGIAYIIKRSDAPDVQPLVRRMRANGSTLSFDLAAGRASPDNDDPRPVSVEVTSAVGSFVIALIPELGAGGEYAGVVKLPTFGSAGLPIAFEIVTDPVGASLSQATSAHIVLPIDDNLIFSPGRGADSLEEAVAELIYDEFTTSWVANFRGAFDLSDGVVLGAGAAEQVGRQVRFEITLDDEGNVIGSFRDLWSDLYESLSADGIISDEGTNFEGTLVAVKVGPARRPNQIDTQTSLTPPQDLPIPGPDFGACAAPVDLSTISVVEDQETFDCAGLTSMESFEAATPEAKSRCALAVARVGLAGDTTASQIQTYLDGGNLGKPFSEFIVDCSTGEMGTCRPTAEVGCARQLLAIAYRDITADSAFADPVLDAFLETTREQFLGAQFGSIGADTETRLEWLRTSTYPAVVTNLVRTLNEDLLEDWQDNVLEVHFAVLAGQFDEAGLTVLAREPEGQAAIDARTELLLEMNQTFSTAVESLAIAAQRWDTLYIDAEKRREKAAYVASRARDLYLLAGVLKDLNLVGGAGFLSATIGAGFASLQQELAQLSLPFNELIYARDAELAVSTSVDPTVTNETLLNDLEQDARAEVSDALQTVVDVVDTDQAEALSTTELRARFNNEIGDLRADLINLCGIPDGCSPADIFEDGACRVRVAYGECGFGYDRSASEGDLGEFVVADVRTSEGGRALLSFLEAAKNEAISLRDAEELQERVAYKEERTAAFAEAMGERAEIMSDDIDAMQTTFLTLAQGREGDIAMLASSIAMRQAERKAALEDYRNSLTSWDVINFTSISARMGIEIASLVTARSAAGLRDLADATQVGADAALQAVPSGPDDAAGAFVRGAIGAPAAVATIASNVSANALESASESLSLASEQVGRYTDATLQTLMGQAELRQMQSSSDLDALVEAAEQAALESQAGTDDLVEALELARAVNANQLALINDDQQFEDRRSEIREEMVQVAGLNLRVEQAGLVLAQRKLEYANVVQRAQLIEAKLNQILLQREQVNLIVGSPAAVFGRINRVVRAENKLEQAKDTLMNWLVALEYYAVRPFMDTRIQILLARNPYQLEEIADEMSRLQGACGGMTNSFTAELSLRDDLLRITEPQQALDGATFTPQEIFRQLLESGYVPVDKRVRYSTDASIGDLLQRGNDIMAASFYVDLNDFANLAATCNAKVSSIDLQLVGPVGDGRPTVSLLYDGAGEIRSCQPGIDEYVAQFGEGTTSFGSVTYVRSDGRSISPVAGINTFVEESANTSLAGLPLSSQYTVLIDKSIGENAGIEWSQLEDIRLRVSYSYQDLFPEGQCE